MKKAISLFLALASAACLLFSMSPRASRSFGEFVQKAENGDPEAMFRLSALLEKGFDSIPPDTLRSLLFLKRSAAAGFAPAQNYLGYLYGKGEILDLRPDSAFFWIRRAADAGDPKALHNIAFLLLGNQDALPDSIYAAIPSGSSADSIAATYLSRAAEGGSPLSMTLLADLYIAGRGVPADTTIAVDLYNEALSLGFRDAEHRLLNLMQNSWRRLSSKGALELALEYWKKGAHEIASDLLLQIGPDEPQTPRAYALLGIAYSRALGLPYDYIKANEYFARAASLGNPSAKFILSESLEIFPDLLSGSENHTSLSPQELRDQALEAGISSPEEALAALLSPDTHR